MISFNLTITLQWSKNGKTFGDWSLRTKIKKKNQYTMILAFEANNASIHTSLKCKYFYMVLRSLCSSTLFVTLLESADRMKSSENSSLLLSWCEFSFRLISRGYATYTLCCCCCFKVLKQEKKVKFREDAFVWLGDKIVWKKGAKLNFPAPFLLNFLI